MICYDKVSAPSGRTGLVISTNAQRTRALVQWDDGQGYPLWMNQKQLTVTGRGQKSDLVRWTR